MCQRNCGPPQSANHTLWFRLADVLLTWQRRVESDPDDRLVRGLVVQLRRLVHMVLGRINEQIPLDTVLEHILEGHTKDALGG